MALGLLWLGLVLLGGLQTQAQASTLNLMPALRVYRVPLQPGFKNEQFQGKWYIVGLAGNEINKERYSQFKMYTTTYKLNEDKSYNVTSTLIGNQRCEHWIRTYVPSSQKGQFTLGNIERYVGTKSYIVRVAATDYKRFAMVFFQKVYKDREFFKVTLYGRTKELTPVVKELYISFAKSLGLRDEHIIFPIPQDQCMDE